jgi:hypothetical protein
MAEPKFKIAIVYFRPKKIRFPAYVPSGSYQITKRLPAADGEFEYVIRSAYDGRERVARESELTVY